MLRSITAGEQIDHLRPELGYRAIKHLMVDEPDLERKEQRRVYFDIWERYRQYLVGDLQKPQALQHVPSSLIEIGITRYENEGKLEPPHRHKQAFEFQYMTAGLTAYLDLTTAEEHVFRKGDFYVIEPGVGYAQKSAQVQRSCSSKCRRETGFRRIADELRCQGSP